ncbi:hypothetical protein [Halospeciosus flavus]|uniref:hypothetical protein n=1 Tax=Halospeciosus flavus TaxID=3032283 RepID=UPI00361A9FC7
MDTAGHRGVTLTVISTIGLALLGSDLLEPSIPVGGALLLCLGIGYVVAPLPNTLEQVVNRGRRGPLHSVFSPLLVAPVLYFSLLGAIAQGQHFLTRSLSIPVSGVSSHS